jgi:hypothetical protein
MRQFCPIRLEAGLNASVIVRSTSLMRESIPPNAIAEPNRSMRAMGGKRTLNDVALQRFVAQPKFGDPAIFGIALASVPALVPLQGAFSTKLGRSRKPDLKRSESWKSFGMARNRR